MADILNQQMWRECKRVKKSKVNAAICIAHCHKHIMDGRTDRWTDRRRDGQTDLLYQYRASVC